MMVSTRDHSRAVVERHAPAEVEADDPVRAHWRQLDWFATPPFGARAGAELLLMVDEDADAGVIWEPACGDGIMASCLAETFSRVRASDIEPQGRQEKLDFLAADLPDKVCRWVITNPPFGSAAAFVKKGLRVAERGVAVLCRLAFLETVDRYALHSNYLTDLAPFCERVPMQLGPWNPKCSTATAYAWFIYDRQRIGLDPVVRLIPPGTRARLSRPDDVRKFVATVEAPLFSEPK